MIWLSSPLERFWVRGRQSGPPPPIDTTTFNVLDYGAAGNGATNDAPAIQAAFTAAHSHSFSGAPSRVLFPGGRTYLVSSGWNMPTIRTNDWIGQTSPTHQRRGIITVSGYGATLRYANASTRFCWLQTPNVTLAESQWRTYGNLVIEGFNIDNNFRQPSADCGAVFWTSGSPNVDNVTIRDITTTGNCTPRTQPSQSSSAQGITFQSGWSTFDQAHWSYMTNITIDNCQITSQSKALQILTNVANEPVKGRTPLLVDNIVIRDSSFDTLHHWGSNVHIGGQGTGHRLTVENCSFSDSTDDGLEINAFNEVHVTNCHFTKNRQAICLTWFSFPYTMALPHYHLSGNTYSGECSSYWTRGTSPEPVDRAPMMPEQRNYSPTDPAYTPLLTIPWGDYIVEDSSFEYGFDNTYGVASIPITLGSNSPPLSSVTIDNCSFSDALANSTRDFISVRQRSSAPTLPISINNCRWRASRSASYSALNSGQVVLNGPHSVVSTDIPGLS